MPLRIKQHRGTMRNGRIQRPETNVNYSRGDGSSRPDGPDCEVRLWQRVLVQIAEDLLSKDRKVREEARSHLRCDFDELKEVCALAQ